ncbi:MAG: hypothetical protein LLG04_00470 [Parachlamydia sp.]|nr:hypothetical protein [Parachlamydia sp.]
MNTDVNVYSLPNDMLRYLAGALSDPDKLRLAASTPALRHVLAPVVEVHLAELKRSYDSLSDDSVRYAARLGYRTTYRGAGEKVTDAEVLRVSRAAYKALYLGPRCSVQKPVLDEKNEVEDLRVAACHDLVSLDATSLTHLERLDVVNCSSLKDLQLSKCHRLKSLSLLSCDKLLDVNVCGLSSLRSLHLEDLQGVTHVDLSELKNLKRVTVVNCRNLSRQNVKVPKGVTVTCYSDVSDTATRVELLRSRL